MCDLDFYRFLLTSFSDSATDTPMHWGLVYIALFYVQMSASEVGVDTWRLARTWLLACCLVVVLLSASIFPRGVSPSISSMFALSDSLGLISVYFVYVIDLRVISYLFGKCRCSVCIWIHLDTPTYLMNLFMMWQYSDTSYRQIRLVQIMRYTKLDVDASNFQYNNVSRM
jgi:hypothetical protein